MLKNWERTPEPLTTLLRERGWRITLPSEAEWERAARGEDGRLFPWGDEPDPNRANYRDSEVYGISTVGCFPGGASPSGCHDMAGNVWERTRSLFGAYLYPDLGDDREAREDLTAKGRRVLRGGAFYYLPGSARCAARARSSPVYRYFDVGFRMVVSPFFSGRWNLWSLTAAPVQARPC